MRHSLRYICGIIDKYGPNDRTNPEAMSFYLYNGTPNQNIYRGKKKDWNIQPTYDGWFTRQVIKDQQLDTLKDRVNRAIEANAPAREAAD